MTVETLRFQVAQHQCDHLGHMNASHYMGYFADAAFSMMTHLELGPAEARRLNVGMAAVRVEIDFVAEALGGDVLVCETSIESVGDKKLVYLHRLYRADTGETIAKARLTAVCLDLAQRRAVAMPAATLEAARRHVITPS